MQQAQNVRALSTINKQIPEVKKLMTSVNNLPWNLRVPLIVQTLGLGYSIDSKLFDKDQVLPRGSIGRKMGFTSLGEVVSTSASDGGLGITWSDWTDDVRAYSYKKAFGIYLESRNDVLSEFKSVSEALGHTPVTLDEYSKARDELFRRQYARRESELVDSHKELEDKIHNVEFEKRHVEQKYTDAVSQLEGLKSTLEQTKSEYESKILLIEAENERSITEAEKLARKGAAKKYYSKIKSLRSEIESLESSLNIVRRQKEQSDNQNQNLNTVIEDLNTDLNVTQSNLKTSEETISRQGEVIARYEQTIDELSERVDQVTTETGIIALEKALEKSKAKVIRLSERLRSEKGSKNEVLVRLAKSRSKMSSMKVDILNKKNEIRKNNKDIETKEKAIASHRSLRNLLVFTTVSSLSLLAGLSYLMA